MSHVEECQDQQAVGTHLASTVKPHSEYQSSALHNPILQAQASSDGTIEYPHLTSMMSLTHNTNIPQSISVATVLDNLLNQMNTS